MQARVKRIFRQFRAFAWTAFAMSTIALAALVGVTSLLLPYSDRFRPEVEQWLQQRLGEPVSVGKLTGTWRGPGPVLALSELRIGGALGDLQIETAEIGFDLLSWLKPGSGPTHFRVVTDEVEIVREAKGRWTVAGLSAERKSAGAATGRPLGWLKLLSDVGLRAEQVTFRDQVSDRSFRFSGLDVRLHNAGDHQSLQGRLGRPGASGGWLEFVIQTEQSLTRQLDAPAKIYLQANGLDLGSWLATFPLAGARIRRGTLDGQLWGRWNGTVVERAQFEGALEDLLLSGASGLPLESGARVDTRYQLDRVAGDVELSFQSRKRWRILVQNADIVRGERRWPTRELAVSRHLDEDGIPYYRMGADYGRIEDVANAIPVFERLSEKVRGALYQIAPHGEAFDLRISHFRPRKPMKIVGTGRVEDFSMRPYRHLPAVAGVAGEVDLDGLGGVFHPRVKQEVVLEFPLLVRWPLLVNELAGAVAWQRTAVGWDIDLSNVSFRNQGILGAGRMHLSLGDGRPFVDMQAHIVAGRIDEAKRFWPYRVFHPELIEWLDQALVGGWIKGAAAILYGDLDDWPFLGHEGRFNARAVIEEALLDFHPDWPAMEEIAAELEFDERGLSITAPSARTAGLKVSALEADLLDYRQPRLELSVQGKGSGADFLDFLARTPIQQTHGDYLSGLEIDGAAEAWTRIEVPFSDSQPEQKVVGHVWLDGAAVRDNKWDVEFLDTRGRVDFSDTGLTATDLATRFRGYDGTLSLHTGEYVSSPGLVAEGTLESVAPLGLFAASFPILEPVLARIPDACRWIARVVVGEGGAASDGTSAGAPRMTLDTGLEATAVTLPAPLGKPAGVAMPLHLSFDLPATDSLRLAVGELMRLEAGISADTGQWGGTLHFGPGPVAANERPGLRVEGHIPALDLDEWTDLAEQMIGGVVPEDDQAWLSSLDLSIDRLRYAGRDLTGVNIRSERDDEYWTLIVTGDQVDGRIRLPRTETVNRLLLAEFERLDWPAPASEREGPSTSPASIPPLRFFAAALSYGSIPFGEVSFESYPTREGMHIDQLETRSETLAISATGDWDATDDEVRSTFAATVSGEDLGEMLAAFNFTPLVAGGQTIVRLDAQWPGSPAAFELSKLGGEIDLKILNGQILEVDPGAGRLFGLLSVQALPRRLRLDFGDLFASGLSFDSIEGKFVLDRGNAHTDNLVIEGPTAKITIKGRTGFAEQDYDQLITVVPEVGGTLPLVGALAGGPGGAAAAFLLQNVFGRQIDKMTQFHYSVTGAWDEPVVELIGADDTRLELETARLETDERQ